MTKMPKRTVKDTVFTRLFEDRKYLLKLYKALHPEDDKTTDDEQARKYGRTPEAIIKTIRFCRDKNILKDFLDAHETEVIDMEMSLFSDEKILKAYTNDIEGEIKC